jgi:3-phenylpropionate/trans-cinnamate dioxygenase ferredoxin reductase subunit
LSQRFLIVGGGQAAVSAAAELRARDATAQIMLISDEDVLPYQRPPLSKAYLAGDMPLDRLLLRPRKWYDEAKIETRLGLRVDAIDPQKKTVSADGGSIPYDRLLLATGSRVRRLPEGLGDDLAGVFYLRTTAHIDAMEPHMVAGKKLVIIGGGYVGLEVAAVARKRGMDVTLVEAAERILQRVAASETSDYFRKLHSSHGVTLLEGQSFQRFEGDDGKLHSVMLADGTILEADVALVGIGVLPNDDLACEAGIACKNGILVDEFCSTSDPNIFAAGDCANFEHLGARIRLESVPNAIHQAEVAAANMAGEQLAYAATPWFWSDQYDVKLQIAGLASSYDTVIRRPGRREGAMSHWYFRGDELIAVDAMNDAPAFMTARKLIEGTVAVSKEVVADAEADLRGLLR